MEVNAHVDVDVIALEQDDEVTLLLELVAPAAPVDGARPPAALQVVLDRSGSMAGDRLEAAKQALTLLVDRLDPSDRFGLVAFDDEVLMVVPAAPLTDKAAAKAAIAALRAGGSTNLSGGLLRGIQEARRVAGRGGATLLLISDGHANAGELDPARLAGLAAAARTHGLTTSTVGIGLGYDERILAALAHGGQGNHVFAEHGDGAAAAVAGEVAGLLSKSVQAASLTIAPRAPVRSLKVWNDLPSHAVGETVVVELGDLWAGEARKVVLTFDVPAMPSLGLAQIAELELRYVALSRFCEQTVTLPVHVNVVPGDAAAGRVRDPRVHTELVFQQVQEHKRAASEALLGSDAAAAGRAYGAASTLIAAAPMQCAELAEEGVLVDELRARAQGGDTAWATKAGFADVARKSRQRGRRM